MFLIGGNPQQLGISTVAKRPLFQSCQTFYTQLHVQMHVQLHARENKKYHSDI